MTGTRNVDRFVAVLIVTIVPALVVAAWLRNYQPEDAGHGAGGHGAMPAAGGHEEMPAASAPAGAAGSGHADMPAGSGHAEMPAGSGRAALPGADASVPVIDAGLPRAPAIDARPDVKPGSAHHH